MLSSAGRLGDQCSLLIFFSKSMDNGLSSTAVHSHVHHKNKKGKFVRCEDPELAAEIRFAKENGMPLPTTLATSPIESKVITHAAAHLQDMKKVGPNQTKMSKKVRNRGVSGCSIKKDGGRFEFGLEDIYLTEEHIDDMTESELDDSSSQVTRSATSDEDVEIEYNKMQMKCIVLDYFENGDVDEAVVSLRKYGTAKNCLVMCVAHIMSAHLEGGSSWGQLASTILNRLMDEDLISRYTLMKGVEDVLDNIDELVIDHPHAIDLISQLFARLLSAHLISHEIFAAIQSKFTGYSASATDCCKRSIAYAANPTAIAEAPSGDHLPLEVLSNQLKLVLKEYLVSNDAQEAAQRTVKLESPHFNHELVYLAGEMAMEKMHDSVMDQLAKLLKTMFDEGEILESCVVKGFERLYAAVPGMSLDLPAAYSLASLWTKKCIKMELITPELGAKCPINVRSRMLSEVSGKLICMDDDSVDSGFSGSVSEG
ncbi:hypothetical protein QR680_002036 [Steinernema hermaphroditum]|uniref:MI domain-containing protein n=1 Tax=Steinernema hermaphroditum TaxID=289476 RepID=A0AA39H1S0_9BILA|nr:hypothetical protein QR680_002036 [Steinernema hermaphroditum]